jgi:hypothetical protein
MAKQINMKKILFIAVAVTFFAACGGGKSKEENKGTTTATTNQSSAPATGKDAELTQWLSGKMLVSTEADPKFDMWNNLKLKADGSCTDKDNAAAKWMVKNGQFIFQSITDMKMDMEKRNDSTLVFKGAISDEVYILKPFN